MHRRDFLKIAALTPFVALPGIGPTHAVANILPKPGAFSPSGPVIRIGMQSWTVDSRVYMWEAEPTAYRARLGSAEDLLDKGWSRLKDVRESTGATICATGSYYTWKQPTAGLYIREKTINRTVSTEQGAGDGLLYVDQATQRLRLVPIATYLQHRSYIKDALQIVLTAYLGTRYYTNPEQKLERRHMIGFKSDSTLLGAIIERTNFYRGTEFMLAQGYTTIGFLDGGTRGAAIDAFGGGSFNLGGTKEKKARTFVLIHQT